MAGWHHWLDGRESEWTLGVGDGQGGLAYCGSWGCKESETTERLNWTELKDSTQNLLSKFSKLARYKKSNYPQIKINKFKLKKELISKFSKVAGYKINLQNLFHFFTIKISERENRKKIILLRLHKNQILWNKIWPRKWKTYMLKTVNTDKRTRRGF